MLAIVRRICHKVMHNDKHSNKEEAMNHKPLSEVKDELSASMFARVHQQHDTLHPRQLTERGKDNRVVYESLQSFRRPLLVRGY